MGIEVYGASPRPDGWWTVFLKVDKSPMGIEGSGAFGARVQKVQKVQRVEVDAF